MQKTNNNQSNILDDFVVFILCHNNPHNIITLDTLKRQGFTGNYRIVIDDEDPQIDEFFKTHGEDHLAVFSKDEAAELFDTMDNSGSRGCAVYARNACFDLAEKLGYTYFIELDDDYEDFCFRFERDGKLAKVIPKDINKVFEALLEYYIDNPIIYSLAICQGGDLVGGINGHNFKKRFLRKAMNSWICSTERRFTFNGRLNDDVNTYTLGGFQGKLFCTVMDVGLNQKPTQSAGNGMTDVYSSNGTYMKSFYTILCCPSFVKVSMMGVYHFRLHHHVNWENAVPKIISDKYKKKKGN